MAAYRLVKGTGTGDGDNAASEADTNGDRETDKEDVTASEFALVAELRGQVEQAREEAAWLRGQVDMSRRAEQELRVLLLEQARALQAATAPQRCRRRPMLRGAGDG